MKTYIKPQFEQIAILTEPLLDVSLPFDQTDHGRAEAFPYRGFLPPPQFGSPFIPPQE
jgi:hypothetical protein